MRVWVNLPVKLSRRAEVEMKTRMGGTGDDEDLQLQDCLGDVTLMYKAN